MERTYSQIDLDERRKIEHWRNAGATVDVIAEKLGRHRSTIFRELARNRFEDREMPELTGYFCVVANSRAASPPSQTCPKSKASGIDHRSDQTRLVAGTDCRSIGL